MCRRGLMAYSTALGCRMLSRQTPHVVKTDGIGPLHRGKTMHPIRVVTALDARASSAHAERLHALLAESAPYSVLAAADDDNINGNHTDGNGAGDAVSYASDFTKHIVRLLMVSLAHVIVALWLGGRYDDMFGHSVLGAFVGSISRADVSDMHITSFHIAQTPVDRVASDDPSASSLPSTARTGNNLRS
jgi:hypothetical protein